MMMIHFLFSLLESLSSRSMYQPFGRTTVLSRRMYVFSEERVIEKNGQSALPVLPVLLQSLSSNKPPAVFLHPRTLVNHNLFCPYL